MQIFGQRHLTLDLRQHQKILPDEPDTAGFSPSFSRACSSAAVAWTLAVDAPSKPRQPIQAQPDRRHAVPRGYLQSACSLCPHRSHLRCHTCARSDLLRAHYCHSSSACLTLCIYHTPYTGKRLAGLVRSRETYHAACHRHTCTNPATHELGMPSGILPYPKIERMRQQCRAIGHCE